MRPPSSGDYMTSCLEFVARLLPWRESKQVRVLPRREHCSVQFADPLAKLGVQIPSPDPR